MLTQMKALTARVAAMWRRVPIKTLIEDEKYQAQRDLLSADHSAEHWTAQADMLRSRIARLDDQLAEVNSCKRVFTVEGTQ